MKAIGALIIICLAILCEQNLTALDTCKGKGINEIQCSTLSK